MPASSSRWGIRVEYVKHTFIIYLILQKWLCHNFAGDHSRAGILHTIKAIIHSKVQEGHKNPELKKIN